MNKGGNNIFGRFFNFVNQLIATMKTKWKAHDPKDFVPKNQILPENHERPLSPPPVLPRHWQSNRKFQISSEILSEYFELAFS